MLLFIGFKENLYSYYYYADIYILFSRWEGFPNTLSEALACGVKVVAFDCKSGPKGILENNRYEILVQEGDCSELAASVLKYINIKNKTDQRAKNFDVKKVVLQYESLLNTI